MENIQRYSVDEVKEIILAHHHKHLPFEKRKHDFVVKFPLTELSDDLTGREVMADVITTSKAKEVTKKHWWSRNKCTKNSIDNQS